LDKETRGAPEQVACQEAELEIIEEILLAFGRFSKRLENMF
jgi:hypothetical protein